MGGFCTSRVSQLLMLVSFIVRAVFVVECEFGDFIVSKQQQADSLLAKCDTIVGSLVIAGSYSGPLVIPSITNITGSILVQSLYDPTLLGAMSENLTPFNADSVVTMAGGDVRLVDVPLLTTVSMANLQNATSINVAFNSNETLNFPALVNVTVTHVFGVIGSIELPSLYNVSGACSLNTTQGHEYQHISIYSAGNLTLCGHLTAINVSSIQTISSTETLASTYGIECSAPDISPSWAANTTLAIHRYPLKANGPWSYVCYPGPKFHRKKLYPVSTGGIVGIAVGIGIPPLMFIVWFMHRRGNKEIAREVEKRRQARMNSGFGEDGHEYRDRHREAPPVYREEGDDVARSTGTGG